MRSTSFAVALFALAFATNADAQITAQQVQAPQYQQQQQSYYSPRLKANFVISSVLVNGYPPVLGARLVQDPLPGSPLRTIGLRANDVITRLDGMPINNYQEIENHFDDTSVRYVRFGSVYEGRVWVTVPQFDPNPPYQPPQGGYPPQGGGPPP